MKQRHETITCPHCGHHVHLELDFSQGDQSFYEECANCGNAIHLTLRIDEQHHTLQVRVDGDDEQLY